MTHENTPETATPPTPEVPETAIMLPRGPEAVTDAAQSVPMTPPDEDDGPWLDRIDWLLLALIVVLSFLVASTPAYNSDVWLHLGTGRLIAHGDYFPGGADPFSCATEAVDGQAAVPWINHSWLFSLGLYLLYAVAGATGTVVVKALGVAALLVVLMQIRSRSTHLLLVAVCLTFAVLALSMRLFLQPILFSYLFLALTLLMLHRAGVFDSGVEMEPAASGERWLWALPVLCLVWVNLDNWFVLGPLVVALCWAGVALQRWRGQPMQVSAGRLGLVLGACLLACLINPFHVRVFQLPHELAYLAVQAGDRLGVPLPDAVFGGGRALTALRDAVLSENRQMLPLTMSPLSSQYLNNAAFGYTIAGICFFPLLGLGLIVFLVTGLVGGRPGAPSIQPARFLVWLCFAVLAVLLYRLIPFFVIVAAPLTALTLGDLLAWYTRPTGEGVPETPWVAPVRLARLLGIVLLLALMLLAWPGWLTGRHEIGARSHVAWEIPADVSLRAAAERLAALQQDKPAGEHVRVFNLGHVQPSLDLPCYCAWFAPGVKTYLDPRYNLFPEVIGPYIKARLALLDKHKPQGDWRSLFERHRINHVGIDNFLRNPQAATGWWAEPGRWLQEFADRNAAVFAWSGKHAPWPADAVLADWGRRAFGDVPEGERPPRYALPTAPEPRDLWTRYLEPPLRLPQSAYDLDAKLTYGEFCNARAIQLAGQTIPAPSSLRLAPMFSVGCVPLAPGACLGPWPTLLNVFAANEFKMYRRPFWIPPDTLPPAVPVLLMRRGWQTVAAAPENERSFVYLANVVGRGQRQEDFWVNPTGPSAPTLRSLVRRTQMIAALWTAAEIGPSESMLQYQVHGDLAEQYLKLQAFDLAADHLELAEKAWDAMPDEVHGRDEWRKEKKVLADRVKGLTEEVKRRKNAFDLKTATLKPMQKVYEAVGGFYQPLTKAGQNPSRSGWGLTGMTLELLNNMKFDALSEREQLEWLQLTIELLFKIGHARDASELVQRSQNALSPPLRVQFGILRAATQGNYDELVQTLTERDRLLAEQLSEMRRQVLYSSVRLLTPSVAPADVLGRGGAVTRWTTDLGTWSLVLNEWCNNRTLLGIVTLEAGDTAQAQRHFDEALRGVGRMYFAEQPIAARYAELLGRYRKR